MALAGGVLEVDEVALGDRQTLAVGHLNLDVARYRHHERLAGSAMPVEPAPSRRRCCERGRRAGSGDCLRGYAVLPAAPGSAG